MTKIEDKLVILEAVVGSHAYGLNHANSDIDMKGIYIEPTANILKLNTPRDLIEPDADTTYFELGKYVVLAANANPTITELMWMDKYTKLTEDGQALIDIREAFLSKKVLAAYGGYAKAQIIRLLKDGYFQSKYKKRREKHARHCFRLVLQGHQLATTGKLSVMLTEEEIAKLHYLSTLDDVQIAKEFDAQLKLMDEAECVLSNKPNLELINDTLVSLRRKHFDT